jgi:monovalent cation:proton antiporter-2 (CPA2) family protein
MNLDLFLMGAFVYLTAAVIAAPIAIRLGLGSVLGYLIAGMIIGPYMLGAIGGESGSNVLHFAEFGVIVMLFLVGLELQPSKLFELRKPILGLGSLQVVLCAFVIATCAFLIGFKMKAAFVIGLILALSSTAIVLQVLMDRGLLKTSLGQSTFSVLLFQDIAIIPMLALLPLIAMRHVETSHSLISGLPVYAQTFAILIAVALIIFAGRFLMRPAFRIIASTGIREIFVAFALLIVVGITLFMEQVGLSAALGAFVGGVVLAESEYRHELEMDLNPFKGLLLAVFFISIGAGIDFNLLLANPITILSYVLGFMILKVFVHFLIAKLFKMPTQDASHFAFILAQGGEFGFVLISFVTGLGLLGVEIGALLVVIVALSMAFAPLMILFEEKIIAPLLTNSVSPREADIIPVQNKNIIMAGFGRFGMSIGRLLLANGHKFVVLEHDAEQIDALRQFGYKIFYGDASRVDLLEAAGAKTAKILIISVDDREKINEIINVAQKNFPHLKIFARAYDRVHAYELLNADIAGFQREMFESSLKLGEEALIALGKHPYEAKRATQLFSKNDTQLLKISAQHKGDIQALIDISRKGRVEISNVLSNDQTIENLNEDKAWQK